MTNGKVFTIDVKEISDKKLPERSSDRQPSTSFASDINSISYWNGLRLLGILGGCAVAVSIQTLIPRHNSLDEPMYWFEVNIPVGVGFLIFTINNIIDFWILTENESIKQLDALKTALWKIKRILELRMLLKSQAVETEG